MSERVLLTGGRGFFGRRIKAALEGRGFEVTAPGRPEFELTSLDGVRSTLEKVRPEIVVHSAAHYGGLGICVAEPATIFFRNTTMIANLLETSSRAGVKRFMAIGSACAYPGAIAGDMREDDFWSGAIHPSVEAYGFTKKILQVGMNAYNRQFGLTGQMPILTNLYGEDDVFSEYRSHVAGALIKRFADAAIQGADEVVCWGTGSPVREFLYVGDAAEAVARLLQSGYASPLNIGTGVGTSVGELASLIARLVGFQGRIVWDASKPDGVARKVLDVSRMKEVLGWTPPTSLEKGLARTIEWYLANKESADARA